MTTPKLRFKEFEGNWNKVKLFQIGSFKNGINKDKNDFGYGVPFINLMDVFGKNSISKNNFDLVNATQKEIENYSLQQGDILFIRSSVKPEGVAETAVILEDLPNTVYSGFLIRYRMNKQVNLFYKKYCFSTENFRKQVLSLSTTSANTNINQESLNLLDLALPNLEEQTKIASFLSAVDEKIVQLTQKHELLSQYKQGMMQKLFSQQLRFKADDGSEFGEWSNKTIGDVANIKRGASPRPINDSKWFDDSSSIGWVRISDVSKSKKYLLQTEQYLSTLGIQKSRLVPKGNLIMSICATIGKPIYTGFDVCIHDGFVVFSELQAIHEYAYYYLEYIEKNWYQYGQPGTQVNLNSDIVSNEAFPFPCLEEQTKIANFLSAIDQKIDVVSEQLEQAKLWKKGLLQQMFV
jgi:type I restriction enzyme S subunit